ALSRRGMVGAGAALATWLDAHAASAVVTPALAMAAVQGATGGVTVSLTAAALTARVLKAMNMTRLKEVATLVLTLGAVVSIGIIAMTGGRHDRDPDRPMTAPAVAPAAEKEAAAP